MYSDDAFDDVDAALESLAPLRDGLGDSGRAIPAGETGFGEPAGEGWGRQLWRNSLYQDRLGSTVHLFPCALHLRERDGRKNSLHRCSSKLLRWSSD